MDEHLPSDLRGRIRAFMFNLGWLPGSDKSCITRVETTLMALDRAAIWIAEGGLITIVCYPGHAGGHEELLAVEHWTSRLAATRYEAQKIGFVNLEGSPPACFVVRRRARPATWSFG